MSKYVSALSVNIFYLYTNHFLLNCIYWYINFKTSDQKQKTSEQKQKTLTYKNNCIVMIIKLNDGWNIYEGLKHQPFSLTHWLSITMKGWRVERLFSIRGGVSGCQTLHIYILLNTKIKNINPLTLLSTKKNRHFIVKITMTTYLLNKSTNFK